MVTKLFPAMFTTEPIICATEGIAILDPRFSIRLVARVRKVRKVGEKSSVRCAHDRRMARTGIFRKLQTRSSVPVINPLVSHLK